MTRTLRGIGYGGLLLFIALFAVTFASPQTVERSAKGFAKAQIASEVTERLESGRAVIENSVTSLLSKYLAKQEDKIREDLRNRVPEIVAALIASVCQYDCGKERSLAQSLTKTYLERLRAIRDIALRSR